MKRVVINKKNELKLFAIESILLLLLSIFLITDIGVFYSLLFLCGSNALNFSLYLLLKKKGLNPVFYLKDIIKGLIISLSISFVAVQLLMGNSSFMKDYLRISGLFILIFLVLVFPMLIFIIYNRNAKGEKDIRLYFSFSIGIFFLIFFLTIDLPIELRLNNYEEFSFSFFDLFWAMRSYVFAGIMMIIISSVIPYTVLDVFDTLLTWINLGFYVQCMFFNQYIGKLTGSKYVWKNHMVHTFINAFFWIGLLFVVFFISIKFKSKKNNIRIFVKASLLFIVASSLIFTLIKAPKEAYSRRQLYLSGNEQFTVGSDQNVILLIADAVDNSYIKEIMNNSPEVFDSYNDFTLYTDTCSVYDLTSVSIPQMLYGYTQTDESDKMEPFLNRFEENGFRMLFYGTYAKREGAEKYLSNYISSEDIESISHIEYNLINSYMLLISLYRVMPCFFKSFIPTDIIDFERCITFDKNKTNYICDNSEFENMLSLSLNPESNRCFIYQHLNGAHVPCDDFVDETKHCLRIFDEYIRQLKMLGVYDNSVIIIASDHGIHDDQAGIPYGVAATPMFMVKPMKEHHDKIQISDKPIYYRDFQASIIKYAGLFDETIDYNIFGKSIDDYPENELRTRIWFDVAFEKVENRKYKYTGNTDELERVVNNNEYTVVESLEFDYAELDK